MRNAAPPACSISSLVASSSAWLRDSSPTRAPACAKPSARRLPIPRPAPVLRTPFSLRVCKGLFYSCVEDSGFHLAGALHLHENPVLARLRKPVGERNFGRQTRAVHRVHPRHALHIRCIAAVHLRLCDAQRRHGRGTGWMHVRENLEVVTHEL